MKKIISTLFFHLCICIGYCQLTVTQNEAQQAAINILHSKEVNWQISNNDIDTTFQYSLYIHGVRHTLLYEVVFASGESILLSGHKNCLPVLAINFSSYRETILDKIESLPDGLKNMIDEYIEQIRIAYEEEEEFVEMQAKWQTLLTDTDTHKGTQSFTEVVSPLLSTKWGQNQANIGNLCNSYNYYVTETDPSCICDIKHCHTGCVATAMAQIMKYWNYPVFNYGSIIQYDWCNMPDQLCYYDVDSIPYGILIENPLFQTHRNAIARLMKDCGVSVNTDYCNGNSCESAANSANVRDALVDVFNYSSDADLQWKSSYNENTWIGRIKNNLNNGWPVYYSGHGTSGHAFVCDGWRNGDYFHFNFGDNGSFNDYWFTLSAIAPGTHNYTSNQRAVFYIYPSTNESYCNFDLELWLFYATYYLTHTTPMPYNIVPATATRLISSPIYAGANYLDPSWRTIPSGATSEYVAHKEVVLQPGFTAASGSNFTARVEPCVDCETTREQENPAIGERNYGGDAVHHVSTPAATAAGPRLHPNPANTTLTVETDSPIREITVYDLTGKTMMTVNVRANDYSSQQAINISSLPAGIYLLRAVTEEGVKTARFVKN